MSIEPPVLSKTGKEKFYFADEFQDQDADHAGRGASIFLILSLLDSGGGANGASVDSEIGGIELSGYYKRTKRVSSRANARDLASHI